MLARPLCVLLLFFSCSFGVLFLYSVWCAFRVLPADLLLFFWCSFSLVCISVLFLWTFCVTFAGWLFSLAFAPREAVWRYMGRV